MVMGFTVCMATCKHGSHPACTNLPHAKARTNSADQGRTSNKAWTMQVVLAYLGPRRRQDLSRQVRGSYLFVRTSSSGYSMSSCSFAISAPWANDCRRCSIPFVATSERSCACCFDILDFKGYACANLLFMRMFRLTCGE